MLHIFEVTVMYQRTFLTNLIFLSKFKIHLKAKYSLHAYACVMHR